MEGAGCTIDTKNSTPHTFISYCRSGKATHEENGKSIENMYTVWFDNGFATDLRSLKEEVIIVQKKRRLRQFTFWDEMV